MLALFFALGRFLSVFWPHFAFLLRSLSFLTSFLASWGTPGSILDRFFIDFSSIFGVFCVPNRCSPETLNFRSMFVVFSICFDLRFLKHWLFASTIAIFLRFLFQTRACSCHPFSFKKTTRKPSKTTPEQ